MEPDGITRGSSFPVSSPTRTALFARLWGTGFPVSGGRVSDVTVDGEHVRIHGGKGAVSRG